MWLAGVAVVAAGVLTAASSARVERPASPAGFAIRVVRLVVANRYAEAWQLLASAQQRSVPVGTYVACERRSPVPGHLADIHATRVRHVILAVPGLIGDERGYAVTVRTTISGLAGGQSVTTQLIFTVIGEPSGYRWILHQDRFNAYRHGHCLQSSPSA